MMSHGSSFQLRKTDLKKNLQVDFEFFDIIPKTASNIPRIFIIMSSLTYLVPLKLPVRDTF